MPEKNIIDFIQNILDRHNGYIHVKRLPLLMTKKIRQELSITTGSPAVVVHRALAPVVGDNFMFHKKGTVLYIMTPRDPAEMVLSFIENKTTSPRDIARLTPFTKKEVQIIINWLADEKRIKISFNEFLEPRLISISTPNHDDTPTQKQEYTPESFKNAFDELDKGKIFVRICDLRKKLSWPREVFDDMLRNLRDKEIIQLHTGDASLMTPQEIQDSFIDENNFRLGTVTWHVR